jgi:hypothetical protein
MISQSVPRVSLPLQAGRRFNVCEFHVYLRLLNTDSFVARRGAYLCRGARLEVIRS